MFLCDNTGAGPTGTKPCPDPSGTVTGTLHAADVIGPEAQGIAPGEFAELVRAIRAGATYANVHTVKYPGGEIRAQLRRGSAARQRPPQSRTVCALARRESARAPTRSPKSRSAMSA